MKTKWNFLAFWLLLVVASPSWAGVHTHIPRGVNAANDTAEVDAGDTFIAAKANIDSLVMVIKDTTVTNVSVKRITGYNLHNPNDLGKVVPAGGGKMRLVSAYDDYRQAERNTSIVRTEGKTHPDWGIKIITAGQDSLVTVDGKDHSRPFVFVGGASNAILDATPVMTSISTQDGRDWVSGTGGADWTLIDWWADQVYQWDTANYSQYKGLITNRNAGSGWLALATSPVIVSASVNDGDVIRDSWPFHRDNFGRQLAYWSTATPGGVSADSWNSTSTMSIFDSGDTATSILMLADGSILSIQDDVTKDNLHWTYRTQAITADSWTQTETWANTGTGSEDLRWGNTVVFSDVAAIPGASSAGRNSPRIMIGTTTQGLALLDAKAGDNTNGAKAYIDTGFSTSLMYGNVHLAFSPASSANLGNIPAIFSTAETAVTRTATPAGPTSHAWVFNGTTSVSRVADHDSLSFTNNNTFTIMYWIYKTDTSGEEYIFSKEDNNDSEIRHNFNGTTCYFRLLDDTNGGNICGYTGIIPSSSWQFITWVYDGSGVYTGIKVYVNGSLISLTSCSAGSFASIQNTDAPLIIGSGNFGAYGTFFQGSISPPVFARSVIPESVIKAEYARGLAAINSPTNDALTSSNVLRVKASEDGKYWGVLNASRVEVRATDGTLIDTLACTQCGTLADFAFAPVPTDSFGVIFGGSTGYRAVIPDVRVEALAQAEWPDHSIIFSSPVVVDSSGFGDFWRIPDATAALSVVQQMAGYIRRGTYAAVDFAFSGQTWEGESDSLTVIDGGIGSAAVTVSAPHVTLKNLAAKTTPGGGTAYDVFYFNAPDFTGKSLRAISSDDDCFNLNGERIFLEGIRGSDCDDDGSLIQAAADRSTIDGIFIKDQGGNSIQVDAGAVGNVIDAFQLDGNPLDGGTSTVWGDGSSAGF